MVQNPAMDERASQSRPGAPTRMSQGAARPSPGLPHPRRFDESWVDVSSQPSSSSLSSIGDDIVTTGLHVRGPPHRRRRLPASARSLPQRHTALHATTTSSQDEYDESDSDDDRLLTNSVDNPHAACQEPDHGSGVDSDSDSGDDDATALGRIADQPVFRPQPNVFSHPPAHPSQRSHSSGAAIPLLSHGNLTRPSFTQRSQTRGVHRSGTSALASAAREDNEAALRASLTTLLSCAAAARGLPKTKQEEEAPRARSGGLGPSEQPVELRLVPESELAEQPASRDAPESSADRKSGRPNSPSSKAASSRESKRPTSASRSPRATKKKKMAMPVGDEATLMSPTLLTWVVSAGVVVLVSVVGFGAGYVIGREVGRQEMLSASMNGINDTSSCGRDVIRTSSGSLKKLRWSAVGKSIVAQA